MRPLTDPINRDRPTLHFFVPGVPAPQGSKRAYVRGGHAVLVESSAKVKPWRALVTLAASQAQRDAELDMMTGPIQVHFTFYLERPKSHYGTGKNAALLRTGAPRAHAQKPDLDKLVRSTMDALTDAGVWRDDAQVYRLDAARYWCDGKPPGALIHIQGEKP